MGFTKALSERLTPNIHVGTWVVSTFHICGCVGFVVGLLQSQLLVVHQHLSAMTMLGITGVVILTFLSLTMATKLVVGREQLVYYHQEIAVLAATALFLHLIGKPLLPYLDVTAMGIGTFLAYGRIGCLMVGCCHGRPSRWGVMYRRPHADAGFPSCLVGVPLFPVQAVEAVLASALVFVGIHAMLKGSPPGTAFSLFILLYALARFLFEFARGDSERKYKFGLSEAQWTSLFAATVDVSLEKAQLLPAAPWHLAIPLILLVLTLLVLLRKRCFCSARSELMHPQHLREIAVFTASVHALLGNRPPAFPSQTILRSTLTSKGLRVIFGIIPQNGGQILHYSISCDGRPLTGALARSLGELLGLLHRTAPLASRSPQSNGIYHFLFHERQST